jgi:hypothetical protein
MSQVVAPNLQFLIEFWKESFLSHVSYGLLTSRTLWKALSDHNRFCHVKSDYLISLCHIINELDSC